MIDTVAQQEQYLSELLEAVQRCAWFLDQSMRKVAWPLSGDELAAHAKDADRFETLAAINERFAKLQDALAAAMRHTAILMGEDTSQFLKVLSLFEKLGVLESTRVWQQTRLIRNHAAHDYDLDYPAIADHFNALNQLTNHLQAVASRLLSHIQAELGITPATDRFSAEFEQLQTRHGHDKNH